MRAEAEKQAAILHADAVREQKIREAQGEAEAVMMVQKALADSIALLNEAAPSDKVLALKGLEAFWKSGRRQSYQNYYSQRDSEFGRFGDIGQGTDDRRKYYTLTFGNRKFFF